MDFEPGIVKIGVKVSFFSLFHFCHSGGVYRFLQRITKDILNNKDIFQLIFVGVSSCNSVTRHTPAHVMRKQIHNKLNDTPMLLKKWTMLTDV